MFDFEGFFNDSKIKKKRLEKMRQPKKPNRCNKDTVIRKIRFKLQPPKPMRTLRFVVNDPYATDSSDDEQIQGKNKVKSFECQVPCPTAVGFKAPPPKPLAEAENSKMEAKNSVKTKRSGPPRGSKPDPVTGKFRGVRRRPWGKWAAEINNPFLHKRQWLGTYRTAEEASEAYEKKRMEFEAIRCANGVSNKNPNEGVESGNKNAKSALASESEDSTSVGSVDPILESPSSVLGPSKSLASPAGKDADKPVEEEKNDDGDEELLQQLGDDFDLDDFAVGSFVMDESFAALEDNFFCPIDDLPIGGLDNGVAGRNIPLPDFDFELPVPCDKVLPWIDVDGDDYALRNAAAPLNISCP